MFNGVSLTLREKLDFIPALGTLWLTIVWAMFTGLWRSEHYPKSWLLHIGYATFRKATARLSIRQMQYVLPPTNKIYEQYARKAKQLANTVDLGDGALGHWIGKHDADTVLIWYHGGGFALPANMAYFKFFGTLVGDASRAGKSFSVFTLTYSLAPTATYPTQLRQAVSALRYIAGQNPSKQILLGGDSAGGNLVGGVMSHLAHTHPLIEPLTLSQPLGGAVMIAPWTMMITDFTGHLIDSRGDLITEAVAAPWAGSYLGTAPRDNYTDLADAPVEWFETFPVRKVLVCAGEREILLPVIEQFVEKLRKGFPNDVEYCLGKREGHVAPVYNLHIGDKTETEQGKRVRSWLLEVV
ncbi:lipase/thioesterase family protein [Aspergillus candidus]|uniref:Lipase/thioesterase family protein n=1 Tax=Aspergillus candidus TaxID=41067 RepID=A0A2I2F817_ASPCN|nr:lipase/thioesterase family protein [Aspergillus candidus]PLB36748.1 lipase/thioesterase family protein [Aspergillus candidus]